MQKNLQMFSGHCMKWGLGHLWWESDWVKPLTVKIPDIEWNGIVKHGTCVNSLFFYNKHREIL